MKMMANIQNFPKRSTGATTYTERRRWGRDDYATKQNLAADGRVVKNLRQGC